MRKAIAEVPRFQPPFDRRRVVRNRVDFERGVQMDIWDVWRFTKPYLCFGVWEFLVLATFRGYRCNDYGCTPLPWNWNFPIPRLYPAQALTLGALLYLAYRVGKTIEHDRHPDR
jgi:hypothetical protein